MFSKGSSSENIVTFNDVRHLADDFALVSYYFGITSLPCFTKSPLREDKHPSFGFYTLDGKKVYWTDLATGERGGVYDLLSLLWACEKKEVYRRIKDDYKSINFSSSSRLLGHKREIISTRTTKHIECKTRNWQQYDIDYWKSYGIGIKWLKYAEIYPISHKIIVSDNKKYVFKADKYAYAFVERKEGNTTLKIYQPLNKSGYKWSNSHDGSVISLWTKVPEIGEKIVICSSVKDALCLSANTNIPAIALQGEGYEISNTAAKELRRRFNEIYVLFDNDAAGLAYGKKLSAKTGFKNIVLPPFDGGKDISDLYKAKGQKEFKNIILKLFK